MRKGLKFCPFCGGEGYVCDYYDARVEKDVWQVKCTGCGAMSEAYSIGRAKTKWNKRVERNEK